MTGVYRHAPFTHVSLVHASLSLQTKPSSAVVKATEPQPEAGLQTFLLQMSTSGQVTLAKTHCPVALQLSEVHSLLSEQMAAISAVLFATRDHPLVVEQMARWH